MKDILAVILIIVMLLLAIITSVLAEHKDEIWECIEFKEKETDKKKRDKNDL